jgi:hypothetical protein
VSLRNKSYSAGIIDAHPCKERKDGAPSVETLHIEMVKGGPPAAAAIQSKGEKGLTTEVVYFPQQKARVLDIAYGLIEHSGEHYGQLVVYYRLAGLVPPESRPKK